MVYGVASGAEGDRLKNKKQKQANPQHNLTIFVLTHRPTLIFQWDTTNKHVNHLLMPRHFKSLLFQACERAQKSPWARKAELTRKDAQCKQGQRGHFHPACVSELVSQAVTEMFTVTIS